MLRISKRDRKNIWIRLRKLFSQNYIHNEQLTQPKELLINGPLRYAYANKKRVSTIPFKDIIYRQKWTRTKDHHNCKW